MKRLISICRAILNETWLCQWPDEALGVKQQVRTKASQPTAKRGTRLFLGRELFKQAGLWYVAGDPDSLGYSTLEDAQIAVQFMGKAAA